MSNTKRGERLVDLCDEILDFLEMDAKLILGNFYTVDFGERIEGFSEEETPFMTGKFGSGRYVAWIFVHNYRGTGRNLAGVEILTHRDFLGNAKKLQEKKDEMIQKLRWY